MPTPIPESDSASRPGALRRLVRQRGAVLGLVILSLLASMAAAAPWLSPRDPIKTAPRESLQPPGVRFVLGSDQYGRDVASRALHGSRDIGLTAEPGDEAFRKRKVFGEQGPTIGAEHRRKSGRRPCNRRQPALHQHFGAGS